mgnify:CR=1 FL=1
MAYSLPSRWPPPAAALGLVQLGRSEEFQARRTEVAGRFNEAFAGQRLARLAPVHPHHRAGVPLVGVLQSILHGLVRDAQGRKMSKTTGNAIDPLEMMSQYGTDALRFTLLTGSTPGNDMSLSEERIIANRNFANKIWQAARFVLMNLDDGSPPAIDALDPAALTLADRWILSRLSAVTTEVRSARA